jgi:hypothetical protein
VKKERMNEVEKTGSGHFLSIGTLGVGVDGRIILRQNFRKWDMGVWTGLSCLRIETGGGHL